MIDIQQVEKDKSITDSGVIINGSSTVPTTGEYFIGSWSENFNFVIFIELTFFLTKIFFILACNSTGTNYDNKTNPEIAFKQGKNKDLCIYLHENKKDDTISGFCKNVKKRVDFY